MPYADPEKRRQRQRAYYEENREKILEQQRGYYEENEPRIVARVAGWKKANPGSVRESARRYRAANREQRAEYARAWRAANPEKVRAQQARDKDRGRHFRTTHGMWPEERLQAWESQLRCCYLCLQPLDLADAHMDHRHDHCGPEKSCAICRRGLAHGRCNWLIGLAGGGDDWDLLEIIAANGRAADAAAAARMAGAPVQGDLFAEEKRPALVPSGLGWPG